MLSVSLRLSTALLFAFITAFAQTSLAGSGVSNEAANKEALEKTQQLLRSKSAREQAIKGDARAEEADQRTRNLVGAENQQAVYELSADIMDNLVKDAQDDPAKMQEILDKAMKDPESFAKSLTPAQKEQLKALGAAVERKNASTSAPR